MANTDDFIHHQIRDLIAEEHRLRDQLAEGTISLDEEHARLQRVETQLDQLWDLLRQRGARRDAGENPDQAQTRSATVVEGYLS